MHMPPFRTSEHGALSGWRESHCVQTLFAAVKPLVSSRACAAFTYLAMKAAKGSASCGWAEAWSMNERQTFHVPAQHHREEHSQAANVACKRSRLPSENIVLMSTQLPEPQCCSCTASSWCVKVYTVAERL